MKTKTLNPFFQKTGKYLRELSVVVVGIAITFTANSWIQSRSEKNDLQLYLNAVTLELEENLQSAQAKAAYFKKARDYSYYLSTHQQEELHPGTLRSYKEVMGNISFFVYKNSAFEMFKSSGSMRLVKDKALLQSIWDCYSELEELKMDNNYYMQRKTGEMEKAMLQNATQVIDIRKPEFNSLRIFFTINSLDGFDRCVERINRTLEQLNKKQ